MSADIIYNQDGVAVCRKCQTAQYTLRRLGFRDSFAWGFIPEAPTKILHATCSNSPKVKLPIGDPPVEKEFKQLLCVQFSSEIAWLMATKPARVTVYLAHPVSGSDFADNVQNATRWLRYFRRIPLTTLNQLVGVDYSVRPLINCPWLAAIEEDELYPGGREAIIQDSRDTAMLFDEVWMLNRVTEGMLAEGSVARVVRDLTRLGPTPGGHIVPAAPAPEKQRKTKPKRN